MVIEQLEADTVGDDGGLAHGYIGKRPGMDEAGVVFSCAHKSGVDCVAHEGGHGVADFQITSGDGFAALVESDRDVVEAGFQVRKVVSYRQNGHALRSNSDPELGLHHKAVRPS